MLRHDTTGLQNVSQAVQSLRNTRCRGLKPPKLFVCQALTRISHLCSFLAMKAIDLAVLLCLVSVASCGDENIESPSSSSAQPNISESREVVSSRADAPDLRSDYLPEKRQEDALPFCLVTHFTQTDYEFPYIAVANHQAYARLHGYGQKEYVGRLSGELFLDPRRGSSESLYGGGLFWQKLIAMRNVMNDTLSTGERRCAWAMWLDADAIFSNPSVSLDQVISKLVDNAAGIDGKNIDVILSEDVYGPVNSGVFFVRNSNKGRSFIESVIAMYALYIDEVLPEQTAISAVAFVNRAKRPNEFKMVAHPNIFVVPQRSFNSFVADSSRVSSFPSYAAWQLGDFIAHFPGVEAKRRGVLMKEVLDKVERAGLTKVQKDLL